MIVPEGVEGSGSEDKVLKEVDKTCRMHVMEKGSPVLPGIAG